MSLISSAQSIVGGDITWQYIGLDSLIVKVSLYNDCNGTQLGNITLDISDNQTGKQIQSLIINKPLGVDLTAGCPYMDASRCQNSNSNFPYGIEKYDYQKLLVLDSNISACEIKLSFKECCRSSNITNGGANTVFYTEAIFNRCLTPPDNSPTFTNPGFFEMVTDNNFTFCNGVVDVDIDPINGGLIDSLAYEITPPLTPSGPITFASPYSYKKPLSFIDSSNGLKPDKYLGVFQFTPTKEENVIFAEKITSFRKGVKMSELTRNFYGIIAQSGNSPDIYYDTNVYVIFPDSQLTISISTFDKDVDSVRFSGIAYGFKFDSSSNSSHHDLYAKGTFTWSPRVKDIRKDPYILRVVAYDDHCPFPRYTDIAIEIYVKEPNSYIEELENKKPILYPNPTKNQLTIKSFSNQEKTIQIYNLNGQLIYSKISSIKSEIINVQDLIEGVYILKITEQNKITTYKFLKQ